MDLPRGRRLALLATLNQAAATPVLAREDGAWIVTSHGGGLAHPTGQLAVYRRAGWDCPQSAAGALAFPQTWGAALCFAAAALSLFADARRGRADQPGSVPARALVVVAAAATLYALLDACFGRFAIWPAPILLIASVGWVTGARFWRFTTIALLCAALAWCLYLSGGLRSAGVGTGTAVTWNLLDRPHLIPSLVVWVGLGLGVALAGIGLLLLAPRVQRP
jgi:hypothetical protein